MPNDQIIKSNFACNIFKTSKILTQLANKHFAEAKHNHRF